MAPALVPSSRSSASVVVVYHSTVPACQHQRAATARPAREYVRCAACGRACACVCASRGRERAQ
eukprot:scaffold17073_cov128-Isochrysis_galbana.AAC.2